LLHGTNLSLHIKGRAILDNIDIGIGNGELVGLIGPNGAGKTSLLRVLANLQKPDSGQVQLDEQAIATIDRRQLARTLGYLEQGAPAHWPLQVRRLVELGRLPYLTPWQSLSSKDKQIVDLAMQQAEVVELAERTVNTLSGGERLRVLIARMFATEPTILLADEPIAALDPYHQLHTMELFRDHCQRGGSAVIVMHDLNMAARFCSRLVLLDKGKIFSEGAPRQVLQTATLAAVYGIETELVNNHSGFTVQANRRINSSGQNK
jgi:iron complex transport system ATP-binding protein